jgi:hypothetical protein
MSQSTLVGAPAPEAPAQVRQGDVLLVPVESVPEGAREHPRGPRIVLAEGEATGHAHAIAVAPGGPRDARLFELEGVRFLDVERPVTLRHEEHAPITLVPAAYRVVIQREFDPAPAVGRPDFRPVAD